MSIRHEHLIFTTHHERNWAMRWAPWIESKSSVIPVGSAIPTAPDAARDVADVVYFGLLRPRKGLEDFLALGRWAKGNGFRLSLRVIGSPDPRRPHYVDQLRSTAGALPVHWVMGLGESEVAGQLARCQVGYMPFPDGACSYRTSLLAMLANGVAVVTTRGPRTPSALDGVVEFARSPAQAFEKINELLRDDAKRREMSQKSRAFASQFSWEGIAQKHIDIYEHILAKRRITS